MNSQLLAAVSPTDAACVAMLQLDFRCSQLTAATACGGGLTHHGEHVDHWVAQIGAGTCTQIRQGTILGLSPLATESVPRTELRLAPPTPAKAHRDGLARSLPPSSRSKVRRSQAANSWIAASRGSNAGGRS
jgi:hypothetical protein